jgi:hypothetical protein
MERTAPRSNQEIKDEDRTRPISALFYVGARRFFVAQMPG